MTDTIIEYARSEIEHLTKKDEAMFLMKDEGEFTVADIVDRGVSKDTVYRTLEVLENLGIVKKVNETEPFRYRWIPRSD